MLNAEFNKETFKNSVKENVKMLYRKNLEEASQQEIYQAVCYAVKDVIIDNWLKTQKAMDEQDPKILYYMSMEFLMGRALGNNLINLTAYKQVQEALDEMGLNLNLLEDQERDPALGNGGLGRLAACFLDSLATLGYPAYGCGIRYKYGMFKQQIRDGYQVEVPDNWLKHGYPFELKRPEYAKEVKFGGYVAQEYDEATGRVNFVQKDYQSVNAIPYDMPIVGYDNDVVNTLTIWDAEAIQDFSLDSFDKGDYHKAVEQENLAKTIVEVLYPNDNHYEGKELRLKQQYFFISASVQRAVAKYKKHHDDITKLYEKVTFQLNDTHPTVAVPELMRILMDVEGLGWDEAWEITTKTCAYTNHTIMAEALEKWPVDLFSRLLPRIYQIVEEINRRFLIQVREQYPGDEEKVRQMAVIYDGQVHMARLAIVGGYSVNGVAQLHTEILKKQTLKDFYEMTPEKFNNKTNGITQRRFLLHGNPLLADWVTEYAGDGWITDLPKIEKIAKLADDTQAQKEFMEIKYKNKVRLAKYIKEHNGIDVDPNSIFDVQVKRLHEYKRQFMNILHIMYLYDRLKKNPDMPFYPRTFIFGAKASAGYERAKAIIKLINSVGDVVNNDPTIKGKIKVVFIEDYRVSNAELIFAAADVSEQISTASKEASGTGNMKFMLNGAITLGTLDGANVEIADAAGKENELIFGMLTPEVNNLKQVGYHPNAFITGDDVANYTLNFLERGWNGENFHEVTENLRTSDPYMVMADFKDYRRAQADLQKLYGDREKWAQMSLKNTANSGIFSADRAVLDYARDIWYASPVPMGK